MTNELDKELYRLFSDKTLSFGCMLFIHNPDGYAKFIEESDVGNGFTIMSATDGYSVLNDTKDSIRGWSIIGHEPHLHDVFREFEGKIDIELYQYISGKYYICVNDKTKPSIYIDYNPTLPLLKQPDDTKSALIKLFTNN